MEFKQKIIIWMKKQVIHMIKMLQCYIQQQHFRANQHNECVGWLCWTSKVSALEQYTLFLCKATNRTGFIWIALIQFTQWFSMHCIISSSISCDETMCVAHGSVSVKFDTVKQPCKSFLLEYILVYALISLFYINLLTKLQKRISCSLKPTLAILCILQH